MISKMTDDNIDSLYIHAKNNGAIGGKIMGAGGGGMFLFCCHKGMRKRLIDTMQASVLKHMDFRFEFEGTKIINI